MQHMFNRLYELYLREICILIDVIMEYQMRIQSAVENEKPNKEKKPERKESKVHIRLLQKSLFCE